MKQLTYLILLLCMLWTLPTFAQKVNLQERKAKLIGIWEVDEGRYLFIKENNEIALERNDEISKTGNWKLSEDGETFLILEDGEIVEEMPIVEVSETSFTFKTGSSEMVLIRREREADPTPLTDEEIAQRKALIVGTWSIVEIEQKVEIELEETREPEIKVTFEENGKLLVNERGEEQEEVAWQLSEDGIYLIVLRKQEDEVEKARILSINEKEFVVLDRGSKVRFVRQQ